MSRGVGGGFLRVHHAHHRGDGTENSTQAHNNRQDTVQHTATATQAYTLLLMLLLLLLLLLMLLLLLLLSCCCCCCV